MTEQTVYEDAPHETVRALRALTGQDIRATIPGRIEGVGAKGLVFSVKDIYGDYRQVSIPIADFTIDGPTTQAG